MLTESIVKTVAYNDYLTLYVYENGCHFQYCFEDKVDWSIDYPTEEDARDAYCARDIRWSGLEGR